MTHADDPKEIKARLHKLVDEAVDSFFLGGYQSSHWHYAPTPSQLKKEEEFKRKCEFNHQKYLDVCKQIIGELDYKPEVEISLPDGDPRKIKQWFIRNNDGKIQVAAQVVGEAPKEKKEDVYG